MDCWQIDEMMSLQLDGLLSAEEQQQFLDHVSGCTACHPVWAAMQTADSLLCASAREPLAVPAGFTATVMQRVAANAAVQHESAYAAARGVSSPGVLPSVLPPQFANGENTLFVPDVNLQEWQHRLGGYLRGIAAVGLSLAASIGVLLALLVSGALQPGASLTPLVETLRTFFTSLDTWSASLAAGFGTQLLAVVGVVMSLMALAAWQIVNGYHRAAETPYEMMSEAAA